MTMSKRIKKLSESPCYQCGMQEQCENKVCGRTELQTIVGNVFCDSEFDYHNCSLWMVLKMEEQYKAGGELHW